MDPSSIPRAVAGRVHRRLRPDRAPDLVHLRRLVRAYSGSSGPDVLLFGDSFTTWRSPADRDRRLAPEQLLARLPRGTTQLTVNGAGYNAEILLAMLRHLEACPRRPRAVVIGTSTRMVMEPWRIHPWFGGGYTVAAMDGAPAGGPWWRLPDRCPPPGPAEWDAYDRTLVHGRAGTRPIGELRLLLHSEPRSAMQRELHERLLLDLHFAEDVARGHPGVERWAEVGRRLRRIGVPVVFFATPVNHEAAEPYWGDDLRARLETGAAAIADALEDGYGPGASVLLSTQTGHPAAWFVEPTRPDEHMNEIGRRAVTTVVADVTTSVLAGAGREAVRS